MELCMSKRSSAYVRRGDAVYGPVVAPAMPTVEAPRRVSRRRRADVSVPP